MKTSGLVKIVLAPLAIASCSFQFQAPSLALPIEEGRVFQIQSEPEKEEREAYNFLKSVAREKPELHNTGNGNYYSEGLSPIVKNNIIQGFTGRGICVENDGEKFAIAEITFFDEPLPEKIGNLNMAGRLLSVSWTNDSLIITNLSEGRGKTIIYDRGQKTAHDVQLTTAEDLLKSPEDMPLTLRRNYSEQEILKYQKIIDILRETYPK